MAAQARGVCHRCGYVAPPDMGGSHCPRDGLHLVAESEHAKDPRDQYLGTTIGGRYPILGILGSGGMGSVYRSVQPLVDRPVALKLVQPETRHAADTGRRFLREARAVASVSHPAIVTLFDFGIDDDGTAFMVMEHVVGRTLREVLESPGLDPPAVVDLLLEVLGALDVAHEAGLIHRDLKPENVMLLREPMQHSRLKVLDFGLAKLVDSQSSGPKLTRDGMLFGTPAYMAPEQVASSAIDARADLYSVGVMLYEGLTGQLPFDDPQPVAVLQAHLMSPVPRLPDFLPREMDAVVAMAMAKKPADRFDSANGMAVALRVAGRNLPLARPGGLRGLTPAQGVFASTLDGDSPLLLGPDAEDRTETRPSPWRQLASGPEPAVDTQRSLPGHREAATAALPQPSVVLPDAAGSPAAATRTFARQSGAGEAASDGGWTATSSKALLLPPELDDADDSTSFDRTAAERRTMAEATLDDVAWATSGEHPGEEDAASANETQLLPHLRRRDA